MGVGSLNNFNNYNPLKDCDGRNISSVILPELIPHIQDAVSHSFDILRPLLIEFGVVQYFLHDAGAVSRGV